MSGRIITRQSTEPRRRGKTDWARFDKITDSEMRKAVESDPDAAPILDAGWFRNARVVLPEKKQSISLRLDRDLLEWFKTRGRGYQTRMNAVLRAYMRSQQEADRSARRR